MQGADDVDIAIELDRVLVILVVNAGGQVDDRIDAVERGLPVGFGTNRSDDDLVIQSLGAAHRATD